MWTDFVQTNYFKIFSYNQPTNCKILQIVFNRYLCMSASTSVVVCVYTQSIVLIRIVLFAERQEERLKTNNRDLSMVSAVLKCYLVAVHCFNYFLVTVLPCHQDFLLL